MEATQIINRILRLGLVNVKYGEQRGFPRSLFVIGSYSRVRKPLVPKLGEPGGHCAAACHNHDAEEMAMDSTCCWITTRLHALGHREPLQVWLLSGARAVAVRFLPALPGGVSRGEG